jgi:serine/threonine-protein kinase
MSLPGADPVAAALAAGETPSPEMVAASQEKEGFSVRAATLCFAAVVACLAFGLWASDRIGYFAHTPLPHKPEALEHETQKFVHSMGYTEDMDRASGIFCCDKQILNAVGDALNPQVYAELWPPVSSFWYRQHKKTFVSDSALGVVDLLSPPHLEEGMIRVRTDLAGKLISLDVRPWSWADTGKPIELVWDNLFEKAGLKRTDFTELKSRAITPGMSADDIAAWSGMAGKNPIIVEAASWLGRPVYFDVRPLNTERTAFEALQTSGSLAFLPLILVAAWLAWNNRRLGRGDRRGAWALATTAFLV